MPARGRRRRSSGSAPSRPSSTPRARRSTSRRSVFVDTALAMLGGGGELDRAVWPCYRRRDAGARRRAAGRRARPALESLKRFGTALRDEIEPGRRSPRLRDRRGAVRPPAALRARRRGRARPSSGATASTSRRRRRPSSRRWRAELELPALARAGGRAPERRPRRRTSCSTSTGRSSTARARSSPSATWWRFPTRRSTWCRRPPFLASLVPFAAYEPPPIYLGAQRGRFYVTVPDPSLPAEAVGAAAPGALPPRHSRRWWRTRRIPATTSSSSPRRGSAPRSGAISGRRSWSRAGRSTASSSWTRRATTGRQSSGSSSW